MLTGSEIRRKFLDFFVQKGHREVHSSSLVPHNDPTLLFTNAGMNQFKDVFLGLEKRDYNRATSSQKCVRAGGKHNDLENVGFTNRHHTFFEMLGNFSFGEFSGGYYKEEAINFAWELITSPDWFGIAPEKLYFTIFGGATIGPPSATIHIGLDGLAQRAWEKTGARPDHIKAPAGDEGLKDNFWQMGETGPCGSCSEIFYDMGVAASDKLRPECAAGECEFPCDCGRYVEIWNLVFMQWDRDAGGALTPLPNKCVDTGMGLERVAAVLQGVISNYETDLFLPLIKRAAELTGADLDAELEFEQKSAGAASLRVIADHARASTFLVSDGVVPSNGGRGFVLRKIIRRAIRHGRLLGMDRPFLHDMVYAVRDVMRDAYPELVGSCDRVAEILLTEEKRFAHTLALGLSKLEAELQTRKSHWKLTRNIVTSEHPTEDFDVTSSDVETLKAEFQQGLYYPGDHAFSLYETYGLPEEFIADACRDLGIAFDQKGFERARAAERARARASWKGAAKQTANPAYQKLPTSSFEGYHQTRSENCEVVAIIHNGQGTQELKPGDEGEIILDHTPFYAESGGQVGDRGWFYSDDHNTVVAEVMNCYYPIQGVRAHQIVMKSPPNENRVEWGTLRVGDKIDAVVNTEIRQATMRNHTATHLLHAGLREILGKHVKQAGSLVAPNHLRFDFSHFTAVEDEELQDIEDLINKEVLRNQKIEVIENVPIDVAINEYKAMALFGEKYGDKVRVIKIGDFSTELCGGTHTTQTGEIGLIKILKEGSVSSGVRRVEAVTGEGSLHHFQEDHKLDEVARSLVPKEAYGATGMKAAIYKTGPGESSPTGSLSDALLRVIETRDKKISDLERELRGARMKIAREAAAKGKSDVRLVRGVKVLTTRLDDLERPQMRELVDKFRSELGSGVVVLGSATNGAVALIVGVTKDLTGRIQAGKVIGPVAHRVGGKGGGRPDLAEAGGKDAGALDSALAEVYTVVDSLLGK